MAYYHPVGPLRFNDWGVTVHVDNNELDKAQKALSSFPRSIESAMYRAAKRAAESMQAEAVRRITARYYVTPSMVRSHMGVNSKIQAARGYQTDQMEYRVLLQFSGRRLPISAFKMTPKQRPMRGGKFRNMRGLDFAIKRGGGMHHARRGFLLEGYKSRGKGRPFHRIYESQDPENPYSGIRAIYSMAVPQMLKQPQVLDPVIEYGEETINKTFKFWVNKAINKGGVL